MSGVESWTIGRLLQWTTEYLKSSGSSSPRLEAEMLLSDARGCQRIELYTAFDSDPGTVVRNRFRELVKRRAAGEPVAYLVGKREFYSLMFQVTPDVLIPRPETEFVVLETLDAIKQLDSQDGPVLLADVGAGSGVIAVSVAKHAPHCLVTAIDISPNALAVARRNAEFHGVADRITFLESDLFTNVPVDSSFDVIASNPPYVAESELTTLAREVRDYEPRHALVAGNEGTECIARLISESTKRLRSRGRLIMEISPTIEGRVRELFNADQRWRDVAVTKDFAGLPRVVKARLVSE